jgi:hypothetical protein
VLDTSTLAVYSDLLIAQDYERYLANTEALNMARPVSGGEPLSRCVAMLDC